MTCQEQHNWFFLKKALWKAFAAISWTANASANPSAIEELGEIKSGSGESNRCPEEKVSRYQRVPPGRFCKLVSSEWPINLQQSLKLQLNNRSCQNSSLQPNSDISAWEEDKKELYLTNRPDARIKLLGEESLPNEIGMVGSRLRIYCWRLLQKPRSGAGGQLFFDHTFLTPFISSLEEFFIAPAGFILRNFILLGHSSAGKKRPAWLMSALDFLAILTDTVVPSHISELKNCYLFHSV